MAIGVKIRMHLGATTGQFNHFILTLKEIRNVRRLPLSLPEWYGM